MQLTNGGDEARTAVEVTLCQIAEADFGFGIYYTTLVELLGVGQDCLCQCC